MPFPWTKNRVTRFSQIVADLQFQSPKRGRSLVVQTGFPTSLIDLIVKNRNRFKKSRFKKPLRTELHDPPSPPPPPPPSPVTTPPITEPLIPYVSPLESPMPSPLTEEITDGVPVPERVDERRFVPSTKLVVVKLMTVMVLLAIVKSFTVAFTVSAFSLLFLEYAVKRVVSFIKPCSEAIVAMESQFQKVLFQLKTKTEKNEPATVHGSSVEIELNLNLNSLTIDEIEVVEEKSELEPLDSEHKIKGSRSGRFKAKMVKKLISKKFRCSKKEKKMEEEEQEKEKEIKENEGELVSEVSSDGIKNEIECISERDCEVDCGTTCSEESKAIGNSGYRILVIIVLVGLIVGRLPALFLTIVWCFLLKIVQAMWKSHIKSSVPNS